MLPVGNVFICQIADRPVSSFVYTDDGHSANLKDVRFFSFFLVYKTIVIAF